MGFSISYQNFIGALLNPTSTSFVATILSFTIIIFFTIGAFISAYKMSIVGGEMAVHIGHDLQHRAQHVVTNYGSLKLRQFAGADGHDPSKEKGFAAKLGATKFGHFIKKTPLLVPIQIAEHHVVHSLDEEKKKVAGKRTSESREALEMWHRKDPRMLWMSDKERYAEYENIKANNDLDELSREQIMDYYGILKKFNLGKTGLRLARPDAFNFVREGEDEHGHTIAEPPRKNADGTDISKFGFVDNGNSDFAFYGSAMDDAFFKMKRSSEATEEKLHHVILKKDGEGSSINETKEQREERQTATLRSILQTSTGSVLQTLLLRKDQVGPDVKIALRAAIVESLGVKDLSAEQWSDPETYSKYFKKMSDHASAKIQKANDALVAAQARGDEHAEEIIKKAREKWDEVRRRANGKAEIFKNRSDANRLGLNWDGKPPKSKDDDDDQG